MKKDWESIFQNYVNLSDDAKILCISKLIFFLSVFARDTYKPQTEDVERPVELRRYNELMHLAATKQQALLTEDDLVLDDRSFFQVLERELKTLGVPEFYLIKKIGLDDDDVVI